MKLSLPEGAYLFLAPAAIALSLGLLGCSHATSEGDPEARDDSVPKAARIKDQLAREAVALNDDQARAFKAVLSSEVKSVSVAKLRQQSTSQGPFHGHHLASEWRELDLAAHPGNGEPGTTELVALLGQHVVREINADLGVGDDDRRVILSTFCIPDPGYAVHLETEKGAADFLICLECDKMDAFTEAGQSRRFPLESDEVIKLKAFYFDEFILGRGLKKKA